ncbi:redoxin [Acidithiobacillus ferrivorans]|nr:TlpA family protein disulfide reductase [Acidithiobacillus ferrivorans]OFA16800.1 redoxin [Acidithiobacillus ferrivorans]
MQTGRCQRWLVELLLLVLLLVGVYVFTQWRGSAATPPKQLPVLVLQSPSGQWLDYQPRSGEVTLINFWSPDCPPCVAEIPVLNGLQKWLGGAHFTVLGVAVAGNAPIVVAQAKSRYGIIYPVYVDSSGGVSRLLGGVTLTPTSLLVNGQGRIVGRYVGAISLPVILWHLLRMQL